MAAAAAAATVAVLSGSVCGAWAVTDGAGRSDGDVIATENGRIRGRCSGSSCVFYGVPFAAPPLGARRWSPPDAASGWAGVRDGTAPAPACWQTPYDNVTVQSEDCLTVDVWAPQSRQTLAGPLPVIVFFYGGGALSGASGWYNFSRFVDDGVVVVAAQYRLGPLGFLAMKEISETAESGTSGMYGAMDCAAATEWAARNAHAFGGDPDRVTIMGQSSGGTMVWTVAAHYWGSSNRPFHRAVILSGSPNVTMSRSRAEVQNAEFATALGCNSSAVAAAVVACLREAPAKAVSTGHHPIDTSWQKYDALTWGLPSPTYHRSGFPLPGIVIVDGTFLSEPVSTTLARAGGGIDLLVSNVAEEDDLCPNKDWSHNSSSGQFLAFANTQLAPWGRQVPAANSSFGAYLVGLGGWEDLPPQQAYLRLASTLGDVCGQLHLLRRAAAANADAQMHYIAVIAGPTTPQRLGVSEMPDYVSRYAYHQYDLCCSTEQWDFFPDFTYGKGEHPPYTPSADDLDQAALLRQIYTQFAAGQSTIVPPFSPNGSAYMVGLIDKRRIEQTPNWHNAFCDALQHAGLWEPFWWAN